MKTHSHFDLWLPRSAPIAVMLLSSTMYLNATQLPVGDGFHPDELKKVRFVRDNDQDFLHPILMLEVARAANSVIGLRKTEDIAHLGRTLNGVFGLACIGLSTALAQRVLRTTMALVAGAAVSASPILVIHAQYFKEDTLLCTCSLASLICLCRFMSRPTMWSSVLLGVTMGLAMSAKYAGAFLVAFSVGWVVSQQQLPQKQRTILAVMALVTALYVFLFVNWPLVDDWWLFATGVAFEARHVVTGHTLRTYATTYWFCFHLMHSLAPGMTAPMLVMALVGVLHTCRRWLQVGTDERILASFVVGYYLVAEASPSKPEPDFMRYMLPIVPVLLIFAIKSLVMLQHATSSVVIRRLVSAAGVVLCAVPSIDSVLLDYHLPYDTRLRAAAWIRNQPLPAKCEDHSGVRVDVKSLAMLNIEDEKAKGVAYLVASSFRYDRYYRGSGLMHQDDEVYEFHRRYVDLFSKHPYVEFRPAWRSFALSNPTIRIVDIRRLDNRNSVVVASTATRADHRN